jgi:hypothetical protein
VSTDPTDKAARRSIAACAREAALARARHEHSDGVIAEAVAADVVAALRDRGFLATTGDTPRTLPDTPRGITPEQFEAARQAADDEALTRTDRSLGDLASEHIVRAVFAAAGIGVASAGGEDNGDGTAEKMPAPKFNVGDDVLYGSWTTPRTIHRRYWDDEADSWVYCAARDGMASVEASEDRLTLAAVAGVSSHPGAQPGGEA